MKIDESKRDVYEKILDVAKRYQEEINAYKEVYGCMDKYFRASDELQFEYDENLEYFVAYDKSYYDEVDYILDNHKDNYDLICKLEKALEGTLTSVSEFEVGAWLTIPSLYGMNNNPSLIVDVQLDNGKGKITLLESWISEDDGHVCTEKVTYDLYSDFVNDHIETVFDAWEYQGHKCQMIPKMQYKYNISKEEVL